LYLIYRQVMQQDIVGKSIVIIQCDSGHLHSNLIACARHKVIDEIVIPQSATNEKQENDVKNEAEKLETVVSKVEENFTGHVVHVVFIVQLPRKSGGTTFVGFQGGNWISVHLDDLRMHKENEFSFQNAIEFSISEIFNGAYKHGESVEQSSGPSQIDVSVQNTGPLHTGSQFTVSSFSEFPLIKFNANRRLRDLIQMACSRLYESDQNRKRTTERINILTDLIPTEPTKGWYAYCSFLDICFLVFYK